jgi:hypothetical protein
MRGSWRLGIVLVAGFLALGAGCGDDDDASPDKGGSGGSSGHGGSAGRRPMSRGGTGGFSPSSGGEGGNNSIDPNEAAYTCKPRPPAAGGTLTEGAACCGNLGVCTESPTGAGSQDWGYDLCSKAASLRCAPRPSEMMMSEDGGVSGPIECRMAWPGGPAGAPTFEGRCLPGCFLTESPIVQRITPSTCPAGEFCAPCYNPVDGQSTGHCERDGDAPHDPAPPALIECGSGTGLCVPSYAAGDQAAQLSQLNCANGELCAPLRKVADPDACFERCDGGDFGPGACVPNFIVPAVIRGALAAANCGAGELCAPCEVAGQRFGVCD